MVDTPQWIQAIIRSTSVHTDFNKWVDSQIDRCNNAYDECVNWNDFTELRAKKDAFKKLRDTVSMYDKQENEDARIRG